MKTHQSLLLSALVSAFLVPFTAYAADPATGMTGVMNHGGELGMVDHTSPKSAKTRQQVKNELKVAHNNGTHEMGNDVSTVKPAPSVAGKSRQDVKQELANISPDEKKRLKERNLGAK